jgi:MinD-like ATPase involved in chromosome partitioning or flagellar assembly
MSDGNTADSGASATGVSTHGTSQVRAVVRPDGVAEVTVDGVVHPVVGPGPVETRAAAIAFIARLAGERGRPVSVLISEENDVWAIVVHPDGRVEESLPGEDGVAAVGDLPAEEDMMVEDDPRIENDVPTDEAIRNEEGMTVEEDMTVEGDMRADEDVTVEEIPPEPPRADANRAPARRARRGVGPSDPTLPTLDDLLAQRPRPPKGPAVVGWQAGVRRMTGGVISPRAGKAEVRRRAEIATVQRSLDGPRTIVVLNPKGGAHKTTATMLIAATFGIHRGGYTLAWDNNETRGTLGWRSQHARHSNTAVNLLQDLDRFDDLRSGRVGDLDNYVRSQGSAQFDVLASDEDAASAASIDAQAFSSLHHTLARFYRIMVIDTGNNMRASNWQAAVDVADQLVIVSTIREDTAQSAAWAIDALRATGHEEAVRRAVTVLSAPDAKIDKRLRARLHEHFGKLTRVVLDVPHDPALVAGGPLDVTALESGTRDAWLHVTAAVADGLGTD